MPTIQKFAAAIALLFVTLVLGSTLIAIWLRLEATEDLLTLTGLLLSWPVAAGGLVFGGGQAMIQAWKTH